MENKFTQFLKTKKGIAITSSIMVLIVVLSGLAIYVSRQNRNSTNINTNTSDRKVVVSSATESTTPTSTSISTTIPIATSDTTTQLVSNSLKAIAFSKHISTEEDQLWVIDTNGKSQRVSQDKDIFKVKNFSGTDLITYELKSKQDSIFVLNYHSGKIFEVNVPSGKSYQTSLNPLTISPNGQFFVYTQEFYSNEITGNDGPSPKVDLYPTQKTGLFILNTVTKKSNYIGNLTYTGYSNWSEDSKYIYLSDLDSSEYHEYKFAAGTYKIVASTGKSTLIEPKPANTFVIVNYYFESNNLTVKSKGETGGVNGAFSNLVIYKNNQPKFTLTGGWADVQPFFAPSPDLKYGLVMLTKDRLANGSFSNERVLVNLEDFTSKTIYKDSDNKMSIQPFWIDNQNIAFAVLGKNNSGDIYLYNVTSSKLQNLTNDGKSIIPNY